MALGSTEDGPYRLRHSGDVTWASNPNYAHRVTFGQKLGAAFAAVVRIMLPVLGLLTSCIALYLYRDTPSPLFQQSLGSWLTVGHLLVPAGFFCVFLTNRRYGPAYAFAQVVVASALVAAFVVFIGDKVAFLVPNAVAPTMRETMAFGGAFFVSSFISIVAFDGARGAQWWSAPLFGALSAAIFFPLIFVPAAYATGGVHWVVQVMQYMAVLLGEGVLLLVPYWMLRSAVPPLSGFGGY